MKAIVDKAACIACGLCVNLCPQVFLWDDDGTAKGSEIPPELSACVNEARDSCPVEAIDLK